MKMSPQAIRVPIPVPEDEYDEIDLISYFANLISDQSGNLGGELLPAFDLDVNDERANIDAVSIENVEIYEDGVSVYYTYSYSAYYGCKDVDYASEEMGSVVGKKVGNEWLFERHISPERLAPNEEL